MAPGELFAASVLPNRRAREDGMGSGAPRTADDGTCASDSELARQSSGDADGDSDIVIGDRDGGGGGSACDGGATSAQEDLSGREGGSRGEHGGTSGLSPAPLAAQHLPRRSGAGALREAVLTTQDAHSQPVCIVMTGAYTPGPDKGNRGEVQRHFKLTQAQADAVIFYSKVHVRSGQRSHACLSVGARGSGEGGGRGLSRAVQESSTTSVNLVCLLYVLFLQAEVTFQELGEDGDTYATRTVSVDQRVGEQTRFKVVEAFEVEDLEEEEVEGVSQVRVMDALLFCELPPGVEIQSAWFKAGTYLDKADLLSKHSGARAARNVLGFSPNKLDDKEVVEVVEGGFQWFPLAQVTGKVVIHKLGARGTAPAAGTLHADGSEIVLCRHQVTDRQIEQLVALQ